jgi:small GTP-binding protein
MDSSEYDCLLKVVLAGDAGVGKTSMFNTFTNNVNIIDYMPTIGVDFGFRMITVNGKSIKLQIWDTAGMERFRAITNSYYRGSDIIILMYDITNRTSFQGIKDWYNTILDYTKKQMPYKIALVGTKLDLEHNRQVSTSEGRALAKKYNMYFIELSSVNKSTLNKTSNINTLFNDLIEYVLSTKKDLESSDNKIESLTIQEKKECCSIM